MSLIVRVAAFPVAVSVVAKLSVMSIFKVFVAAVASALVITGATPWLALTTSEAPDATVIVSPAKSAASSISSTAS